MPTKLRYLGLDVHAETIAVAVADADGETRSLGIIPNRPDPITRLIRKLGPPARLQTRVWRALGHLLRSDLSGHGIAPRTDASGAYG